MAITPTAPYNFVPLIGKLPLIRYPFSEDGLPSLPSHGKLEPDLHSGEIHVKFTADTPIFVSDGNGEFTRDSNGRYAIPGSSVRGLLRQNMQILGLGMLIPGEDFEDQQLLYRMVAPANGSVSDDMKFPYRDIIAGTTEQNAEPKRVKPGYITQTETGFWITPTKNSVYYRLTDKDIRDSGGKLKIPSETAKTMPVYYLASADRVIRADTVPFENAQSGILLYTGKRPNKGMTSGSCYIFPEPEPDAVPQPLSKEDTAIYQMDWEYRKNSLNPSSFWELPKLGEQKAVFYLSDGRHTYWGRNLYLRIGYPHSLREGLPKNYQDAMTKGLDYPRAILGYISPSGSYRSRVSIGDFAVNGVPQEAAPCTLPLMGPKPSYFLGYLKDGENYLSDSFQLRGIKQYWLKEYTAPEKTVENEKVLTQLKSLRKGTVFEGVIRFHNLHPDELGLLLWCIRLEEGCYQSLGIGKPYGLGRIRAEITQLREFSLTHPEHALYGSLCSGSIPASEDAIEGYLNSYWNYAFSAMHLKKKETVKDLPSIRDFFYLHRVILDPKQCCYMDLKEFKACKTEDAPLPTIRQFSEENPLPDNSRSEQNLPKIPEKKLSPAEQLAAKFNAGNAVSSSSKGKRRK